MLERNKFYRKKIKKDKRDLERRAKTFVIVNASIRVGRVGFTERVTFEQRSKQERKFAM